MDGIKRNIVLEKSFEFALNVIVYCEILEEERKYIVARQLLKSGTSVGANIREAQNAESRADFIHKIKIALKESEETKYWLALCEKSKSYPNPNNLIKDIEEIHLILSKIVGTSRKNSINEPLIEYQTNNQTEN